MKKGFTMIELLATIIVFTIVATIGGKIVLNVIEKVKEHAFTRSVEFAMSSFDFARQYHKPGIETIEITSEDLKLEHNKFKSGTIILDDEDNAKVLYATDGYFCATGLLGNMSVTKGDCVEDLTGPIVTIEASPSLDKSELEIRLNASDLGVGLDLKAYSFDNGLSWQTSNEITIDSSYKDIIKVRDLANNITAINYNISKLTINANGGVISGLDEVSIYWLEDTATMNVPTPIKIGYSFTGWINVGNSSISGNNFTMGTMESSLTANYINATFTLQVNPNGGVWDTYTTTQSYSKVYGTTTTINNPIRAGYTFNGWSLSGANSSIIGTTFTMGSANTILTANWLINYYTLSVNANGGTWIGATNQTLTLNSQTIIENPTRLGYVFAGWSISGANSSISGITFTMGSTNATLTANWYSYANMYTYTGSSTVIDDGSGNWRIKFLTSGTFTLKVAAAIDVFLVGGGSSLGGGGYTATYSNISVTKNAEYSIVVGAGGAVGANGSSSTAFEKSAAAGSGANGGSGAGASGYTWNGGTGGSEGSNGYGAQSGWTAGIGQGTTTREFGEANGTIYSGGGGGGGGFLTTVDSKGRKTYYTFYGGAGGAGGGGTGASSNSGATEGVANTGGGGGLGIRGVGATTGGSGIVVIRNVRVPDIYTYTGSSIAISDGGGNWRIKLLTSGTFTPKTNLSVDIFLVGGGGGSTACPSDSNGGSGGGYTATNNALYMTSWTAYTAIVGSGGTTNSRGETTSFLGQSAAGGYPNFGNTGGAGGSGGGYGGPWIGSYYCCAGEGGYNGNSNGANCAGSGSGQGTTTREFGDVNGTLYAGGGGGYGGYNSPCGNNSKTGGLGGGGGSGQSGSPNTGGGGGACANGGSGIIVIRNHR